MLTEKHQRLQNNMDQEHGDHGLVLGTDQADFKTRAMFETVMTNKARAIAMLTSSKHSS